MFDPLSPTRLQGVGENVLHSSNNGAAHGQTLYNVELLNNVT